MAHHNRLWFSLADFDERLDNRGGRLSVFVSPECQGPEVLSLRSVSMAAMT